MRPEVRVLRKNVHDFIKSKIFASNLLPPVLEIGPMQEKWTPVKKYFVDTRRFFSGQGIEYAACDCDSDSGSEIICDVLSIENQVEPGTFGTIIALEVLEHVSEIWRLPQIFWDVLKPEGWLFVSTPYFFYRHAPFPDYWRISADGLKLLFDPYFEIDVQPLIQHDDRKPIQHTMVARRRGLVGTTTATHLGTHRNGNLNLSEFSGGLQK